MTSVAIIGAGPVGTSLALALLGAGMEVTLYEREAHLPADPRAATLQPPTLEMLAGLGSGDAILAQGLRAPLLQFRDRARDAVIAEYDYGRLADETPYPFALQCEQVKIAATQAKIIAARSPGTLRMSTTIIGFAQDAGGVTLTARGTGGGTGGGTGDTDGTFSHRVDYVVGCDGRRSATRKILGIDFVGFGPSERFLVLSTQHDFARRGFRLRNALLDPAQWGVVFKVPDDGPPGLWRIVLPAPPPEIDATADAFVAAQLAAIDPALSLDDIRQRNVYALSQRVAATFHRGRVFLAGDAAHVNNPLGGLGMNSGIHDAMALAETLVAARDRPGDADAPALAYSRVRRGIAERYVQARTLETRAQLAARSPTDRQAVVDALRADADDPARHRRWVRDAALISSLRDTGPGARR